MIEKTNKGAMYVEEAGGGTVSMMAEIDATPMDILPSDLLKELPILPLRNAVMFPEVVLPVTVGRPSTMKLLKYADWAFIYGLYLVKYRLLKSKF